MLLSKQIVMDAKDAESLLLQYGFEHIRTKGSHRIYKKGSKRVVVAFHGKKELHPKVIKDILDALSETL